MFIKLEEIKTDDFDKLVVKIFNFAMSMCSGVKVTISKEPPEDKYDSINIDREN